MLNVENRTPYPGKEGRVRLRQDNGQVIEGVLEMADDATAPGTPWNRQSGRLLQADIRSYPVADGQTIAAGDVVDVIDGQIQKTLTPQANVESVILTSQVNKTALCLLTDNYAIFGLSTSSGTGHRGANINNNTITPVGNFNNSISISSPKTISIKKFNPITDGSVPFLYYVNAGNGFPRVNAGLFVPSSSNLNVNYSGYVELNSSNSGNGYGDLVVIDEENMVAIALYDANGLAASVVQITDATSQTMSILKSTTKLSGNTSASYISATRLPDSGITRRVCVCYSDGGDSNKGKAVIVSIDASNNITWGNPVVFDSGVSYQNSAVYDGEYINVCYTASNILKTCILNPSSLSVSGSLNLGVYATNYSVKSAVSNGNVVVIYSGSAKTITRNGTTLSSGDAFEFISGYSSGSTYANITSINGNGFICSYADTTNSSYGTATVLTVLGDQIAGSFLDGSKDAIALQSGTSGQSIEVIYSGITNVDWVTAGQTITSDGVYGVGALDGVLQVWSAERPGQIVTGSYTGTGQNGLSTQNSLSFNRQPLAVIISDNSGAYNGIFIYGSSYGPVLTGSSNYKNTLSWSANVVSWYTDSGAGPSAQLNASGTMYHYTAFLGG